MVARFLGAGFLDRLGLTEASSSPADWKSESDSTPSDKAVTNSDSSSDSSSSLDCSPPSEMMAEISRVSSTDLPSSSSSVKDNIASVLIKLSARLLCGFRAKDRAGCLRRTNTSSSDSSDASSDSTRSALYASSVFGLVSRLETRDVLARGSARSALHLRKSGLSTGSESPSFRRRSGVPLLEDAANDGLTSRLPLDLLLSAGALSLRAVSGSGAGSGCAVTDFCCRARLAIKCKSGNSSSSSLLINDPHAMALVYLCSVPVF